MTDTLKLKAVLLTTEDGKAWLLVHQSYLSDLACRILLNDSLEG